MKRIGLLGGMSWQSTILYYSLLNEGVFRALGGVHSCDLVLRSFDFETIKSLQTTGDWDELDKILAGAIMDLKNSGCEIFLICTNTMHKCAPYIEANTGAKVLHIVDAISKNINAMGLRKVGFLGTKYAMEEGFLHDKYRENNIETIIPNELERQTIHRIIFDELVNGIINDDSRNQLIEICNRLRDNGAEGIIAGCTEIELILKPENLDFPLFESTKLHCVAAIEAILANAPKRDMDS